MTTLRLPRDLDSGCVWVTTHRPSVAGLPHGEIGTPGCGKDRSGHGLQDSARVEHVMSSLG